MPHLYLSAAHKSSGKTTLTLGLARALHNRGLKVQTFKKGPDYIDPIWHGMASTRPSYNLDFHMMDQAEILALFGRHAGSADISLIEGNKGLYDGMDVEGSNSNASLAKLLAAPVVLVLDTTGMSRGIAPMLLGHQAFDPAVRIAGVILNQVGGPRHEGKLRAAVERYTDLEVLGVVQKDERLAIAERHLGLIPGNEIDAAETRIEAIAAAVAAQVDLDAVLRIADTAPAPAPAAAEPPPPDGRGLHIAYSYDRAFSFYYQEDLDTLRAGGAHLHPLDTLVDKGLPEVDGLLLGGGFPELFLAGLEANQGLRASIRREVEAGLPVYAECGGLIYLARSLAWNGARGDMVGIVPGDVSMGRRPVGRGYALLDCTHSSPLATASGHTLPAHEFHYSTLQNLPDDLIYAYNVQRGHGIDGQHDGIVYKNLLAAYCHRRGTGRHGWIAPFLEQAHIHAGNRHAARIAA